MIDTHAHIYDEAFDADRDEVLARARAANINKVFLPNINASTVEPMLQLCRSNPGYCFPMLGLHPEDVREDWADVLDAMEPMLQQPDNPFIAIGEVGLDFYWDTTFAAQQREVFTRQVAWAAAYNLPLMIHTRNAHREVVDIVSRQIVNRKSSNSKLCGVFHCFGGTADEAEELLGFDGFMLGIGGVVTYKRSNLPDVLRQVVPLERIVTETDSPYLAPVPHRGKRNESAYVTDVIATLARIYERTPSEIAQITTENALKTFPKAR